MVKAAKKNSKNKIKKDKKPSSKKVSSSNDSKSAVVVPKEINQEIWVGVIVLIVIILIIGLIVLQPAIIGEDFVDEKDCDEITYYETITIPANVEMEVPYAYEVIKKWEGIPVESYSLYNPHDFYVRQARTIKNMEEVGGEFTVTCSFTVDGITESISQTNFIMANTESSYNLNYKTVPGKEVVYGGCTIVSPKKIIFSETETTEQIMKTKIPEGC